MKSRRAALLCFCLGASTDVPSVSTTELPALILVDVRMPGMSGLEATAAADTLLANGPLRH